MDQAGSSAVIIPTDQEIRKVIFKAVDHFKTVHGCQTKKVCIKNLSILTANLRLLNCLSKIF